MIRRRERGENRTDAEIREHYEIEVELANRLRRASKRDRKTLYTSLYDELFRRVPHHQQLTRKQSADEEARALDWQLGLLKRSLSSDTTFLEVGAGDCLLATKVAGIVKAVYAVDVSSVISANPNRPENCKVIISDGSSISLPNASIDVAYSNQLIEHVHPDDAVEHLQEVYRVLKPGCSYVCVTPNRVNGPWDISYYFDEAATGFHLKEYRVTELLALLRQAGFRRFKAYAGARGLYARFPVFAIVYLEELLLRLPAGLRSSIGRSLPVRMILGIKLAAMK